MQAATKPKLYNPRHPERTLLYQTVAEHYETWPKRSGDLPYPLSSTDAQFKRLDVQVRFKVDAADTMLIFLRGPTKLDTA